MHTSSMAMSEESLQISQTDIDNWSTREQLCLISAVSCSSDQNWVCISRALNLLCGNSNTRPPDWFSQKNCAVKYSQLLESFEHTERKRSDENIDGSSLSAETTTDFIIRLLKEDRIQELKTEIRAEQEEYAKVYKELKALQSDQLSENSILKLWLDIEKQQEMQRIEEMKHENKMREREQRKQDMQLNWKTITETGESSSDMHSIDKTENESSTDKTPVSLCVGANAPNNQQFSVQSGTSPLLSSLLKSPTVTTPSTTAGAIRAAATAPTITTLLTSGSIPNTNLPAITLRNNITTVEAAQILTRPISGPFGDSLNNTANSTQNLLSPSQSAPTLSMLLEKNKSLSLVNNEQLSTSSKTENSESESNKKIDSNNDVVPMDIEGDTDSELVKTAKTRTGIDLITALDSDASDPNEEQQLLEVFKNIGNIDDFEGIDVADVIDDDGVDFLKGVDEETTNNSNAADFEPKIDSAEIQQEPEVNSKEVSKEGITILTQEEKDTDENQQLATVEHPNENVKSQNVKVETISSDDSNDNIPLAAVASLENKERTLSPVEDSSNERNLKESDSNILTKYEKDESKTDEINDKHNTLIRPSTKTNINEKLSIVEEKYINDNGNEDIIVIPTDDDDSIEDRSSTQPPLIAVALKSTELESNSTFEHQEKESPETSFDNDAMAVNSESTSICIQNIDDSTREETEEPSAVDDDVTILPPPAMSIADTDEDSSTTDISITTRKEEKMTPIKQSQHQLELPSNESKIEYETAVVKPPVLRKLRDRDRSESPMIDNSEVISNEQQQSQRSRRRYSSTTIMDSIPNSPASSDRDDVETKISKKYLTSIYNGLMRNRSITVFQRAFSEERRPKHNEICLRIMDLQTIKKNIDSGTIKSVNELQRDILLMCQNALMVLKTNSNDYKMVNLFIRECQTIHEFSRNSNTSDCTNRVEKETKGSTHNTSVVKVRGSSRKSQRISCPN